MTRPTTLALLLALGLGAPAPTPIAPRLPDVTGANDGAQALPAVVSRIPVMLPVVGSHASPSMPVLPAARPRPSAHPETVLAAIRGTWAYAEPSHGPGYLAIPEGPGYIVLVCGPLDCFERVSTDAGPALYLQRAGRIGDLSSVDFIRACGLLSAGLCRGSYEILGVADQHPEDPPEHPDDARLRIEDGGPNPTLPATDAVK